MSTQNKIVFADLVFLPSKRCLVFLIEYVIVRDIYCTKHEIVSFSENQEFILLVQVTPFARLDSTLVLNEIRSGNLFLQHVVWFTYGFVHGCNVLLSQKYQGNNES